MKKILAAIIFQVEECSGQISPTQAAFALGVLEAGSDMTLNLDDLDQEVESAYEQGRTMGQALAESG